MEVKIKIIGSYEKIYSLANNPLNYRIEFKHYEPHLNGVDGEFYAILNICNSDDVENAILNVTEITIEELEAFCVEGSEMFTMASKRKAYFNMLDRFIDARRAYFDAELTEISHKYKLKYGDSVIQTAQNEFFMLVDVNEQINFNIMNKQGLYSDEFRLYGYKISHGKRCLVNRNKIVPIPTCFTFIKICEPGSSYYDYELCLYGESSIKVFDNLEIFKKSL